MIGIDTNILVFVELLETPHHRAAHELLRREVFAKNERIALAPQLLTEFVHVATDPRRFRTPLTIKEALDRAQFWWDAEEVEQVFPTAASTQLFLEWMMRHLLGRKRLLDTYLAATYWTAGVRRIMTSNVGDFSIFGVFEILSP